MRVMGNIETRATLEDLTMAQVALDAAPIG
jgi:hypothetical protein